MNAGMFLTVVDEVEQAVAWVDLAADGDFALNTGETLQLTATAYAADGEVLEGRAMQWSSSRGDIATVSDQGLVSAVAGGSATIAVSVGGQQAEVTVLVDGVVEEAPVDHVSLEWVELTLPVGEGLQLVALPRDAQGEILDRPVTWTSNNPTYVSVTAGGFISALEQGGADITATSEGKSASVRVYATAVTGYTLAAVGGSALPASLGSYTSNSEGVTLLHRVSLSGGSLAIDHAAGTYELTVTGSIYTSQQFGLPFPVSYESIGTVEYNANNGFFTFTPSPFGAPFSGQWTVNGQLLVQWQPEPRIPGAKTFLFDVD